MGLHSYGGMQNKIAIEISCCKEYALKLAEQVGTSFPSNVEFILKKSHEIFERENINPKIKNYAIRHVLHRTTFDLLEIKKIALNSKYLEEMVPAELSVYEVVNG